MRDLEKARKSRKRYSKTPKGIACRQRYIKTENFKAVMNKAMIKYYNGISLKLMDVLGGRICKCGYHDVRALQIDHINGQGRQDEIKHKGRYTLYNYYLKHTAEAKQKLQVLCANCNWIKRYERAEFN